jgi:hypothetical protein
MSYIRYLWGLIICLPVLLLPYRLRVFYLRLVAGIVHFPFKLFGKIARFIMRQLEMENPYEPKR